MTGKQLYICDTEPVYLKRLAAYLNRQSGFLWRIKTYTDLERCLQEKPDTLLISGKALEAYGKTVNIPGGQIFFLEDEYPKPEGMPGIKKYQSARRLYGQLLELLGDSNGSNKEIIGIYNPVSGPEAEVNARKIAKERSEEGEVLVFVMTEFPMGGGEWANGNLNEWFYYQEQEKGRRKLEDFIYREGDIDYIRGFRTIYDMAEIDLAAWRNFFERELCKSRYSTVILVFDRMPLHIELMLWCDMIYVTWGRDGYGEVREQLFKKMAVYMGVEELTGKMKKIQEVSDGGEYR